MRPSSSTFLVKMSFICVSLKNHFHFKGWALNLVLIQRPGGNSEVAYWLLFWYHVLSLSHRNYKCFCPKQYFFSPDRLQGRVEQAIKSSHRYVETFCCYFGIFPLQGSLAVKRCDILTMLLSPSKSATNKHLFILLLVHVFPKILTPSFSFQNLCLYIRNAHFNRVNFERKNSSLEKHVVEFV